MNAKTFLLLFLGMSVSFGVVLYVMFAVLVPDAPPPAPRRTAQARPSRPQTPPPDRAAVPRSGTRSAPSQSPAGLAPSSARPADSALSSAASPQIAQLKKDFEQQILLMKKERDRMLTELVRKLAAMPPAQAATQLGQVDDEVASLALARMTVSQRRAILGHLDPKRARALSQGH